LEVGQVFTSSLKLSILSLGMSENNENKQDIIGVNHVWLITWIRRRQRQPGSCRHLAYWHSSQNPGPLRYDQPISQPTNEDYEAYNTVEIFMVGLAW